MAHNIFHSAQQAGQEWTMLMGCDTSWPKVVTWLMASVWSHHPQLFDSLSLQHISASATLIHLVPRSILVSGPPVRKAKVCQRSESINSQSLQSTASRKVHFRQQKTNPFLGVDSRASYPNSRSFHKNAKSKP